MAISKVENLAEVLYCMLKFAHDQTGDSLVDWNALAY